MSTKFETNLQQYMDVSTAQRLGFRGLQEVLPPSFWKKHALWEIFERDEYGNLTKHTLGHNLILDNGATLMLKAIYTTQSVLTATPIPPFQYAALAQGTASTAITGSTSGGSAALSTSTAYSTIYVSALPAGSSIANGQSLLLTYGNNTQTLTATAAATAGNTSINVTSFTPNFAYPAGTSVTPQPSFPDNPTGLVGAVYTAIPSSAFVYNNGQAVGSAGVTGNGNRVVNINNVTFTGTSSANGTFTEIWLCNTNPVSAAGQVSNHITLGPSTLANGGTLSYNLVEKL